MIGTGVVQTVLIIFPQVFEGTPNVAGRLDGQGRSRASFMPNYNQVSVPVIYIYLFTLRWNKISVLVSLKRRRNSYSLKLSILDWLVWNEQNTGLISLLCKKKNVLHHFQYSFRSADTFAWVKCFSNISLYFNNGRGEIAF